MPNWPKLDMGRE